MMFTGGAGGGIVLILGALVFFYGIAAYLSTFVSFKLAARTGLVASAPPLLDITKAMMAGFAVYLLCGIFTAGVGFVLFPIVNIIGLLLLRAYVLAGVAPLSRALRVFRVAGFLTAQVLLSAAVTYGAWRSVLFAMLPTPR
jgi:hypothetical protein